MTTPHRTFEKLVQTGKPDFIGMVAYTIYKKEKLNWIHQYKTRLSVDPTYQQVNDGFNIDTDSDLKVEQYRTQAEALLNQFISEMIVQELNVYKTDVRNDEIVMAVHKGFWRSVGENVVAGLVGAGIVTIFSVIYWLAQVKDDIKLQQALKNELMNKTAKTANNQ